MNLIGHWPAIITNQKLEIIKTTEREDFKQHLVRFYWTPLEQTYGYLLEPNKKGKHPAVITVSTNRKQLSDGEEKLIEISPTN